MNARKIVIAAFLFMLVCMGIPAAPANASGDGSGSSPDNRFVVDNYDHGWKAEYLVSKTYENETHCSWNEHYEWDINGVYYELDAWENLPCWYGQVPVHPRDPGTFKDRPVVKKYNCSEKAHHKARKHHKAKRWARHHKSHMRHCH